MSKTEETVLNLNTDTTTVTLQEDELGTLRTFRTRAGELTLKLGQNALELEMAQALLNQRTQEKQEIMAEFGRLQQSEQDMFKTLTERYGLGNLNLETGVFTPAQN